MTTQKFLIILLALLGIQSSASAADAPFVAPPSPRQTFSFDPDWRFIRQDVPGAQAPDFDDSTWTVISTPHTFNDVDSFRVLISHGGGDRGTYKGLAWYRKHFRIPAELAGNKIFIEFEGMRQAGDIFLNGKEVGLYENGVTAYGLDITSAVNFGDQENVLAVQVDNRTNYAERATKTPFEWNTNDFNPDFGGINRHVWLHVTGKIYQTLPLYYGLQSTGTYVYGTNYDIPGKSTDVTTESEVKNESGDRATVTLSAAIVDEAGQVCAQFEGDPVDMVNGEKSVLTAAGPLKNARFWSVEDPYLYDVYTTLTVDGKIVDVRKTTTGFRKTEFKGGAGTGGVYVNDKFVYLKGFSQRASDEWAGLGQAYPDWMHDFTAKLLRDSHGNYMRWMHVSPQRVDVDSFDRYGIIEVCPAGDKERDPQQPDRQGHVAPQGKRQWEQRVEVMRDSMIYFRNSPSILFWETGNTVVMADEMQEMVDLRKQWDPNGGRVIGGRGDSNNAKNTAVTPIAEYYGVMMAQDRGVDQLTGPNAMFRAYSIERRDRAPLIEAEDFREEAARRFWDNYSPPRFGFKPGPNDTYDLNSETFIVGDQRSPGAVARYNDYWTHRISLPDPAIARWSGYSSIYFTDSDADGRQDSSEVCRVSGKLDAVRLPKEIYYAHRVMQSTTPDIHIIGHWTYPAGTVKTVYVVSNCQSVQLFLNGSSLGVEALPTNGFLFAFRDVHWQPGELKAVGTMNGQTACQQVLHTAGPAKKIKLTPITAPSGLRADGSDVALIDLEVVDALGERCPTDEARIDFTVSGPAIWRGGYNSGKLNSTNNLYIDTECGINRVSLRSTLTPGTITVTASREGLESDSAEIKSSYFDVKDGLTRVLPQRLPKSQ
jgi:beta-galactosidase